MSDAFVGLSLILKNAWSKMSSHRQYLFASCNSWNNGQLFTLMVLVAVRVLLVESYAFPL
jgi:hypothetical protein